MQTAWKTFLIMLLALILARFFVVGQAKILFNTLSSDGDESAYLSLGLGLFEGVLTDGARPPLYPLLLAFIAEREWAYFTNAKMLTMALGGLAILATFWAGKSLFSWETGLLGAFLLSANKEFHLRASTVYGDVLFVSILVGSWYFLIKTFQGWRYCVLAGIFIGLSYLSKGSAPLLFGAWGLAAVLHYRHQIWRRKEMLLVPLFFLLTASPLLLYNARTYGNPFYNVNSAHVLWMDRWDDSQVADPADLPTMATYFQSHTPADMIDRLSYGLARLNDYLPYVLIPSRTLEPDWLAPVLLTAALVIAGAVLVWRREWLLQYYRHHQTTLTVSLLLLAVFYIFLAWYARLQVESRFIIPLLGPFYLLLAEAVVGLVRRVGREAVAYRNRVAPAARGRLVWGTYLATIGALVGWGLIWLGQSARIDAWSLTVDPYESDRQANREEELVLDWLLKDAPPGPVTVIFGPSKSLPLWKFPARFTIEQPPIDLETWDQFQQYVAKISPDYLIMDSDTVRRRRDALTQYFSYKEKVGIAFERLPPGWAMIYLHNPPPHTWAIFEPFSQPAYPVQANLGQQVALLGYDIRARGNGPDRTLRVAVYWQALVELPEDYTIFLHLTAPDGFVKAQKDRQPFDSLWPTRRWTPGDVLADRFEIPLEASMQPGDYLLLAGMYTPQTGQRLPLVEGPVGPSPHAVLLGQFKIEEIGQ